MVESWTRAGILAPSLWVTPRDVVEHMSGPPSVDATLIHAEGTRSVDLFEYIGRFRLDRVRVAAAHLVLNSDAPTDTDLIKAARSVAEAVKSTLPRRADDPLGSSARLHRSVVVIPSSGATSADPGVFEPQWNVNVVISPEDRPDLDRASIFVRHPGNFAGHAAASLAAIGGILRGVDAGVLDDLVTDSTTQDGDVVVARVTVRSVIGEDVVDAIGAKVLNPEPTATQEAVQLLSWARPAVQPGMIVASATEHILHGDGWASKMPSASNDSPRKSHEGFRAAFTTATAFNVRTTWALLSWALTFGRKHAERGATRALTGSGAGILVTLGPRPVDELERASARLIAQEREGIDRELRMQSTRASAAMPGTWGLLRKIALGLIDGGELGDFPEPRQAGKREVVPPGHIVALPETRWIGRQKNEIHADDPMQVQEYREHVKTEVAVAKSHVTAAKAKLDFAMSEEGKEQAAAAAETKEDSAGDTKIGRKSGSRGAPSKASLAKIRKAQAEVAAAERERDAWLKESDAYDVWYHDISESLAFRLGDDVGRRIHEHAKTQEDVLKQLRSDAPPAAALKAAQTSLRRLWAISLPVWLVLGGIVALLRYAPRLPDVLEPFRLSTGQMAIALAILFGLLLIILILGNHAFYQAVLRYEWDVQARISRLRSSKDAYVHSGQEKARLEMLYRGLQDWSRILGEIVHRPWAAFGSKYEDLPEEVIDALPASMGVARQPTSGSDIPIIVLVEAASLVYKPGWASRQFYDAYDAWDAERVTGSDDGYRSVDLDTSESPSSPRARLKHFFASGEARQILTDHAHQHLRSAVLNGDFELPERVVGRIGRYGDDVRASEPSFYEVTATENTAFVTDVFTPAARQKRFHYVDTSVAWMPTGARVDRIESSVELRESVGPTAVRVDISRRLPAIELTPFVGSADAASANEILDSPALVTSDGIDGATWY